MDKLKFYTPEAEIAEGSEFSALAVKTTNFTEVNRAYHKVKQMFPAMDHITAVYRHKNASGCQDDGDRLSTETH